MEPHVCPDCQCLYRPRHRAEAERCWSCLGMDVREHVAAIGAETGRPVVADRDNGRPAPGSAAYLRRIEALLR
jgi:hypothetical protein